MKKQIIVKNIKGGIIRPYFLKVNKMKFKNVLIASDYDGTLYNSEGIITRQVREKIAYFIAKGGRFTVSTGRSYQGFHAYDKSYINAPVLLANGALAYDYEKDGISFLSQVGEEIFDVA